ncbi:MAG: hypothetical protein DIZ80_13730 [endosymbiont of Galathealinum brachiosum]|uniref:Uncharacterized protein n=1 Tax=endosymbiont of Galathealinum brachiosum TaxID=2200906 RepID=A0A370DBX8_9GAMM|nr:MAG: hypothetical protein DIZ80_13730 [endosymbiont of Galathealinum brachiosum]
MMNLLKKITLTFLFCLSVSVVFAEDKSKSDVAKKSAKKDNGVKELSGISIIGNKEAPKSLYIVPWKNSEVGVRSSLTSGLLDDSMRPIDKEVFMRELDFYELSHTK